MIHLTMTGPYAGQSFCGTEKPGDEFNHANVKALEKSEYRAKVCPQCLDIWDGDDADDDLYSRELDFAEFDSN